MQSSVEEDENKERLATELMLLEAAYPGQIKYNEALQELNFSGEQHSTLSLRVSNYPIAALPEVLSASDTAKRDLRGEMRKRISQFGAGEEVLDAIISDFLDLVTSRSRAESEVPDTSSQRKSNDRSLTVIIWLHHLLASSKRKLAITPSSAISGITRPGYPGVLLFTGPAEAVKEHVETLKQENWQAFQVRLEDDQVWPLLHGKGIREVETMGEVVTAIGESKKEIFLEVMKIK